MTPGTERSGGSPEAAPPLDGITVLDFTRILSGPYATMLLADLGADVIKVERPRVGDDTRGWGPPFWEGMSSYFAAVNRGKRSLALDLGSQEGRNIVREIAASVDVVVENFRPGVTSRLGIAYEQLRDKNSELIYATINGFGSVGPRAQQAGTEVIVEAESGLMAMMGVPGGPPVRFGVAMVDIATGMSLVNGVLAALLARAKTGMGRQMEFPLFATAVSVLATVIASASTAPEIPHGRFGSGHPSIVPYSAFEASDGWVVLGAINEPMWVKLCEALELFELLRDPRFTRNDSRVSNRTAVEDALAERLARMSVAEIVRRLDARGVLVAPVRAAGDAMHDPQVAALRLLDIDAGAFFARTPLANFNPEALARAPLLGQHSLQTLADLGVPQERVQELERLGVISAANASDESETVRERDKRP